VGEKGVPVKGPIYGSQAYSRIVPGTPDVPSIVGAAKALELMQDGLEQKIEHMKHIRSRNNEIFIKNFGIASTPKGSIKNGAIKDVKSVTNEIRKVMENINTKAKNAKIVMSGTNIISRVFVVEKIPGKI